MLQQNLSKVYEFESAEHVCNLFNNLINTLKKEKEIETGERYPWLDKTDERKYMSDREILERYKRLDNTCLQEDVFHSLKLSEDLKDIVVYYHILEVPCTFIRESLWACIYLLQFGNNI